MLMLTKALLGLPIKPYGGILQRISQSSSDFKFIKVELARESSMFRGKDNIRF